MFPFTDVPACNLPVYASQPPLPGATQDSGQRLLARLCRDRHLRRLSSTHLQGTTRTDPYVRLARIRLPPRVCDGQANAGFELPYAIQRM